MRYWVSISVLCMGFLGIQTSQASPPVSRRSLILGVTSTGLLRNIPCHGLLVSPSPAELPKQRSELFSHILKFWPSWAGHKDPDLLLFESIGANLSVHRDEAFMSLKTDHREKWMTSYLLKNEGRIELALSEFPHRMASRMNMSLPVAENLSSHFLRLITHSSSMFVDAFLIWHPEFYQVAIEELDLIEPDLPTIPRLLFEQRSNRSPNQTETRQEIGELIHIYSQLMTETSDPDLIEDLANQIVWPWAHQVEMATRSGDPTLPLKYIRSFSERVLKKIDFQSSASTPNGAHRKIHLFDPPKDSEGKPPEAMDLRQYIDEQMQSFKLEIQNPNVLPDKS